MCNLGMGMELLRGNGREWEWANVANSRTAQQFLSGLVSTTEKDYGIENFEKLCDHNENTKSSS